MHRRSITSQIRLTGGDTFDTATTRQTSNGRLSYALDVVTKNLSVTLSSAFSEALSTFAACNDASVDVNKLDFDPTPSLPGIRETHVQS